MRTCAAPDDGHVDELGAQQVEYPVRVRCVLPESNGSDPATPNRSSATIRNGRLAGQKVGVLQVSDRIWLVTFMHYELGYLDDESCRLEPIENPFGPKVLSMFPE